MSHWRDSGSDAVHVKTTSYPPPENLYPNSSNNSVWATEDDDYTESPSKKTRSSSAEMGKSFCKTKLCVKSRIGTCPYVANSCHFAHSSEELRRPPPNQLDTAEERSIISAESGRSYKGRHCKKYIGGDDCPYGENCTFLHDEASRNRESYAISLGPRGYGAASDNNVQIVKPSNWKTRICNKWELTGYCPFGTNCHFAHGASELHRFGGGLVEGEGKIGSSANPATKQAGQVDRVSSLVSSGVSSQLTSSAVIQKLNGVRTLRKWKGPDKISRVYGDWIDDIE